MLSPRRSGQLPFLGLCCFAYEGIMRDTLAIASDALRNICQRNDSNRYSVFARPVCRPVAEMRHPARHRLRRLPVSFSRGPRRPVRLRPRSRQRVCWWRCRLLCRCDQRGVFDKDPDAMTERVTAWQCIGCGRIEGARPVVRFASTAGWISSPPMTTTSCSRSWRSRASGTEGLAPLVPHLAARRRARAERDAPTARRGRALSGLWSVRRR